MSMLLEKRNEVVAKIQQLELDRVNLINAKVAAYKEQLEKEPLPQVLVNAKKCLEAIDEVIRYESMIQPEVSTPVVEPTKEEVKVEEVKPAESVGVQNDTPFQHNEAAPIDRTTPVESVQSTVEVHPEEIAQQEARPGMAYIGIPDRR